MPRILKQHLLGILGIIIGFAAIGTAAYQDQIRESLNPPTEDNRTLKELALEASKKFLKKNILKEDDTQREKEASKPQKDFVSITFYGLGIISIFLGIGSYIRKENLRLSISSFSCGLIAVAWSYVMYAVFVFILLLLISSAG